MAPVTMRILVIRAWNESIAPLRAALVASGVVAHCTRVDLEPALDAALGRGGFDAIVLDAASSGLALALVEERLRAHRVTAPLLAYADVVRSPAVLVAALAARRN